jgi:hypothetical protein
MYMHYVWLTCIFLITYIYIYIYIYIYDYRHGQKFMHGKTAKDFELLRTFTDSGCASPIDNAALHNFSLSPRDDDSAGSLRSGTMGSRSARSTAQHSRRSTASRGRGESDAERYGHDYTYSRRPTLGLVKESSTILLPSPGESYTVSHKSC